MSTATKQHEAADRRTSDGRMATAHDRRSGVVRVAQGDRRGFEQRGVAESMVDALEDILRWERASERSLRVAGDHGSTSASSDPVSA